MVDLTFAPLTPKALINSKLWNITIDDSNVWLEEGNKPFLIPITDGSDEMMVSIKYDSEETFPEYFKSDHSKDQVKLSMLNS